MTRNNNTGENIFYGEFLLNAQGEDVVGGIRTPGPVIGLKDVMPNAYQQLLDIKKILEDHFREMQDIEFTIQEKKLYMLQTPLRQAIADRLGAHCGGTRQGRVDRQTDRAVSAWTPARCRCCCCRSSTPRPGAKCWPRACPRRRARRPASSPSPPRMREAPRRQGREGAPDPQLHQPRRRARHARQPGHPDQHRRPDQSRGHRRLRLGQAVRRRLCRAGHRRQSQDAQGRRQDVRRKRLPQHRRQHRRGDEGRGGPRFRAACPRISPR